MKPYVFVTTDYGKTWKSISSNLPMGNVNVIREDPKNSDLLYLGTEYAFYVSLDRGATWKRFMTGLPTVRIDDILVHSRDHDLIVATHGRSIYIMDDITALEEINKKVTDTDVTLFEPRDATLWLNDTTAASNVGGQKVFRGENPQEGTAISYYLKSPAQDVQITVSDYSGKVLRTIKACDAKTTTECATKDAGLNRVLWNLRGDAPELPANVQQQMARMGGGRRMQRVGPAVQPGTDEVMLTAGGKTYKTKVTVDADSLTQRITS
jgi:hypothetical protein